MKIREQLLGTAHPDYAQSVKNLAACFQDQQRFHDALPLFRQYVLQPSQLPLHAFHFALVGVLMRF